MRSGPEPFDSPDAQALCAAQQAEMLALYEGEADIGPTRDAWMFVPPDGVFILVRDGERPIACGGIARVTSSRNRNLKRRPPSSGSTEAASHGWICAPSPCRVRVSKRTEVTSQRMSSISRAGSML